MDASCSNHDSVLWYRPVGPVFRAAAIVGAIAISSPVLADALQDPALTLMQSIEHDRTFSRSEFLSLFVGDFSVDTRILLRGLSTHDPYVRMTCALHLGELPAQHITTDVIASLEKSAHDPHEGVAAQAIASIMRLGKIAPNAILPLLIDESPLTLGAEQRELKVGDLALATLHDANNVELASLVGFYNNASRLVPAPLPGTLNNVLSAISMLLHQSPERHASDVQQLMKVKDLRLREIAFDIAATLPTDTRAINAALAAAVREETEQSARSHAANALAARGTDGRSELLALTRSDSVSLRGAALQSLLRGGNCQSPILPIALAEHDSSVREASFAAMLRTGSTQSFPCLISVVVDATMSRALRANILHSLNSSVNSSDADDIVATIRPILKDRHAELYRDAWSAVRSTYTRRETSNWELIAIAHELLLPEVSSADFDVVCTLTSLSPTLIAADAELLASLSRSTQSNSENCVSAIFSKLDPASPDAVAVGHSIPPKMMSSANYSSAVLSLLETVVPSDTLTREWRPLADHVTGERRMDIYRIAAIRGVAVNDAIALFTEVLNGKLGGLGIKSPDLAVNARALRDHYMPAAVRGLLAIGSRGERQIGEFLRDGKGSSLSRLCIISTLSSRHDDHLASNGVSALQHFKGEITSIALNDRDAETRATAAAALPLVLGHAEMRQVLRQLLTDRDPQMSFAIANLMLDESSSAFARNLGRADIESAIVRLVADADARRDAARLLYESRSLVSRRFSEDVIGTLLRDDDDGIVADALRLIHALGSVGLRPVQKVLSSTRASHILKPELSNAISGFGRNAKVLLPSLLILYRKHPDDPQLLKALGSVSADNPKVSAILQHDLESDDSSLRTAALAALTAHHAFFSIPPKTYVASLLEQNTSEYVQRRITSVLDQLEPGDGGDGSGIGLEEIVVTSVKRSDWVEFPWPPPQWSFKELVPDSLFSIPDANLGKVSNRIVSAIRSASSDYDYGFFQIPSGFVVLTRLERIKIDGAPYSGGDRWTSNPVPAQSLEDYVLDLFLDPPGYFRVIGFFVSSSEPMTGNSDARLPAFAEGAKELPEGVAKIPYSKYRTYALVYTFERFDGGKMSLNYAGSPSGLTHLVASGIWGQLGRRHSGN